MLSRLSLVAALAVVCLAFIVYVESADGYIFRNAVPLLMLLLLSALALRKGGGTWTGAGWRWPLATLGFAVPTVGLSIYLHFGYLIDRDGIVSGSLRPEMLFAYLPIYTLFAGCIGLSIGWIIGRNV